MTDSWLVGLLAVRCLLAHNSPSCHFPRRVYLLLLQQFPFCRLRNFLIGTSLLPFQSITSPNAGRSLRRGRAVFCICTAVWTLALGMNYMQMRNVGVLHFDYNVSCQQLPFISGREREGGKQKRQQKAVWRRHHTSQTSSFPLFTFRHSSCNFSPPSPSLPIFKIRVECSEPQFPATPSIHPIS